MIDKDNEQELLTNFFHKYGISFLDLTSYFPYFPRNRNELRLPDMHLSEKGYELLSSKILEFLIQTNKLPKYS
jgi:lysophospholipase L1-like esterase